MGEGTKRLEWDLESERQDLGRNLQELERRAGDFTDWRWYYRNHPLAVLGTAFGGAVLLGLLTRTRSASPVNPPADWDTDALVYEPRGALRTHVTPHLATSAGRVAQQAGVTLDHMVDALLGVAAAKAIDYVGKHIPGFNDEYTRRHGSEPAF